jgi:hypothetical protein
MSWLASGLRRSVSGLLVGETSVDEEHERLAKAVQGSLDGAEDPRSLIDVFFFFFG